ncbi:hypothetical protein NP590_12770 [Methylomonas sp. SURF-2]|uniref:Uncharacterized protein n=1 Tax=Methylomonas subterranea TaxID=2952225 RepID=A0ABT1THP6_9GAMM|nr:hypothetical protein [Methylomonas sp. SURF-2]MCQ8104981.1 hypothetical protein [Methylomonas sp. SURF-2]
MTEIPPLSPSPVLPAVHKLEREKGLGRDKGRRKSEEGSGKKPPSPSDEQAEQHIDEIV